MEANTRECKEGLLFEKFYVRPEAIEHLPLHGDLFHEFTPHAGVLPPPAGSA
ncbi:MAG: hypothetical protein Kow0099_11220 [Candidatus Abyssubacteria bacterium]